MKRTLKYKFPLLVICSSVVVAVLPIVSVMVASLIAAWGNCTLHEGFVNPCQIGPWELGETLYTMAVAGWYVFLSIPLGMLGVALGAVGLVVQVIWSQRE